MYKVGRKWIIVKIPLLKMHSVLLKDNTVNRLNMSIGFTVING